MGKVCIGGLSLSAVKKAGWLTGGRRGVLSFPPPTGAGESKAAGREGGEEATETHPFFTCSMPLSKNISESFNIFSVFP